MHFAMWTFLSNVQHFQVFFIHPLDHNTLLINSFSFLFSLQKLSSLKLGHLPLIFLWQSYDPLNSWKKSNKTTAKSQILNIGTSNPIKNILFVFTNCGGKKTFHPLFGNPAYKNPLHNFNSSYNTLEERKLKDIWCMTNIEISWLGRLASF